MIEKEIKKKQAGLISDIHMPRVPNRIKTVKWIATADGYKQQESNDESLTQSCLKRKHTCGTCENN